MSFGKLLLWGGAGYLGYKLLTGSPYMAGDPKAVSLVEAAKARLDPMTNWEIGVQKAGPVTVVGKRNGQVVVSQTFPNQAAALSWISGGQPTGKTANVSYFTA